jgi:Xaa-Pro aminopeptidase
LLLTDFRYVEQGTAQAQGFEIVKTEGHPWPEIAKQVTRLGARRVGFEAENVTFDQYERIKAALADEGSKAELAPLRGFVEASRQIKDSYEIAKLRRAVLIGDRAIEKVAAALRPGITERDVAWRLEVAMREAGADGLSFPIIVAAGPNGAMPHHRPGDRPIRAGEPVVIDMGCKLGGYCSDLTRTFTIGEPDAQFWTVYQTVLAAQHACEDEVLAGMLGKDADLLARNVIEKAGHLDHFGHGTGHGVGLAIHENPYLSPSRGDMPLLEGTVVTVEPGIYIPGWGGVRIEDMIVVGRDRCQILTTAHKMPVVDTAQP